MAKEFKEKTRNVIRSIYFFLVVMVLIYIFTAFLFCDFYYKTTAEKKDQDTLSYEVVPSIYGGTVEFHVAIPNQEASNMVVEFMTSHCDVLVFDQNEQKIFETRAMPSIYGISSGSRINFVNIPYGTTDLRVVTKEIYKGTAKTEYSFVYGDCFQLMHNIIEQSVFSLSVAMVIITAGIILIIYWISTHRRTKQNPGTLYFGIFAIILGLWSMNETDLAMVLVQNRAVGSLMGYLFLLLIPFPVYQFTACFFQIRFRRINNLGSILSLLSLVILSILHITSVRTFKENVYFIHGLLIIALLYTICCMIAYIARHKIDRFGLVNLVAFSVLLVSAGLDMGFYYKGYQQTDVWGKLGLLAYITALAVETMRDALQKIEEGRKADIYKEMAITDVMTGMYNRSAFEQWEDSKLMAEGTLFVIFDLNDLKWHNDTLGHAVGDEYLIASARMIRKNFGIYGSCYRIGGDEFCAIIPRGKTFPIEQIIADFQKDEELYNQKSDQVRLNIAFGYAMMESADQSFSQVRDLADEMMYKNKKKMKESQY